MVPGVISLPYMADFPHDDLGLQASARRELVHPHAVVVHITLL
jgi:hypothetical protein